MVAILLSYVLGVNISVTYCVEGAMSVGKREAGVILCTTHVGFRRRRYARWCESVEAQAVRMRQDLGHEGHQYSSVVSDIQILHQLQEEQLERLRQEQVELHAINGVSPEDVAEVALLEMGLKSSEIWVGKPTRWLRDMLYIRTHTVPADKPMSRDQCVDFWGRELLRETSSEPEELHSSPVLPVMGFCVGVKKGEEIGHFVNISDINRELTVMGVKNDPTGVLREAAQVIEALYTEYELTGRTEYVEKVKEVKKLQSQSKRGSKRGLSKETSSQQQGKAAKVNRRKSR